MYGEPNLVMNEHWGKFKMIKDYSEITAGLQSKIYSMHHALNDKKYWAALDIIRDLKADFNELELFVKQEIEARNE